MPPAYNQGPVTQQQTYQYVPNEVFGIALNWFAPRVPVLMRLPRIPDGNSVFQMVGYKYRPRLMTVNGAVAGTVATSVVLVDNTSLMKGDVLKNRNTGEYLELTADPNPDGVTVTVRRAVGGTTPVAIGAADSWLLVSNTRTGAENLPTPVSSGFTTVTQYMQTIQHPYSVGGSVQANTAFPLLPGTRAPLESFKMVAMQNAMDDMEISSYYGVAEASSGSNSRPKMGGFRNLISSHLITTPSDASGYKATSFQRDFLTGPRKTGGSPSVVVLASNWMDAFSTWGQPLQRLEAGTTTFGTPINVYAAPFLGDVTILEASLLPDFTGFSLTEAEARWRVRRPMIDEPYGKIGDTSQGHMLAEGAVELDNEAHHAWVEGVTAFSA